MSFLSIDKIVPNPLNPRKNFEDESLKQLIESIKNNGFKDLYPIVVRPKGDKYEIIIGERRFRAAKILNLKKVPCIITEMGDNDTLLEMLVENIVRKNLSSIEKAEGIRRLLDEMLMKTQNWGKWKKLNGCVSLLRTMRKEEYDKKLKVTTEEERKIVESICGIFDISWKTVDMHWFPLLGLPDDLRDDVETGRLNAVHAKKMKTLDKEKRDEIRKTLRERKLTIPQIDTLINHYKKTSTSQPYILPPNVVEVYDVQFDLNNVSQVERLMKFLRERISLLKKKAELEKIVAQHDFYVEEHMPILPSFKRQVESAKSELEIISKEVSRDASK
jgi:ParB family chromosome partitioning protein